MYGMRPVIPEEMTDRIESVDGLHGYESNGEFVRDAVRRRLNELEAMRRRRNLKEEVLSEVGEDMRKHLGPEDIVFEGTESGIEASLSESARKRVASEMVGDE